MTSFEPWWEQFHGRKWRKTVNSLIFNIKTSGGPSDDLEPSQRQSERQLDWHEYEIMLPFKFPTGLKAISCISSRSRRPRERLIMLPLIFISMSISLHILTLTDSMFDTEITSTPSFHLEIHIEFISKLVKFFKIFVEVPRLFPGLWQWRRTT